MEEKLFTSNITIKLTEEEASQLLFLVSESKDTDNKEWDNIMKSIEKKLEKKLNG